MVRITPLKSNNYEKFKEFINNEKQTSKLPSPENLNGREEILVCLDENEKILGVCKTTFTDVVTTEAVDYVYVGKDFRRDTNGTLLLVAVMQRAVNRLITRLITRIDGSDEVSRSFFKKLGFTVEEEKENGVYLSKSLLYMYKTEA